MSLVKIKMWQTTPRLSQDFKHLAKQMKAEASSMPGGVTAKTASSVQSELHDLLCHNNYDIVCITESWLHANTPNSLLDP